jgi:anti-sigma factor RsiW
VKMNEELSLKLQAYADGELSGREAGEVADVVAKDAEARALLAELKNTRSALAGYEAEIKLPESREFYWSKIEREIRRLEKTEAPRPEISLFAAWRRLLVPAGALAVLVLLGFLMFPKLQSPPAIASAESEFTLADSDDFTYHDYANGTTLVWLSYPAEDEFADTDSEDILD